MALYKNVLHHTGNSIPKAFLETLGVWVSLLNACGYCVEHHFHGLKRLMGDDAAADAARAALEAGVADGSALAHFAEKERAAIVYAERLTRDPAALLESDIAALRSVGWDDGEILEINQVSAYFNYANRTVLGLGCSTDGDILGLSPNDNSDPENWSHS